ncbi:hypothetical protein C8J30_103118 [Rhodobacter viridis]|uniref:Uncharacterized protein n=1 Tax=Rhodobacter viridis TaxID=1054202 RepID=A0A318U1K8_9RHOB|nr:hypothetical protein C8J30_103118 [Rhodobacter viridis]
MIEPKITYRVDGHEYVVVEQERGNYLCRKVGEEGGKVYYFNSSTHEGPFDDPPVNIGDWL